MNPFGTDDIEEVDQDAIWYSDYMEGGPDYPDLEMELEEPDDDPIHLRD